VIKEHVSTEHSDCMSHTIAGGELATENFPQAADSYTEVIIGVDGKSMHVPERTWALKVLRRDFWN